MNSGKSTSLMQVAYNYEERDQQVILLKSTIDTKGSDRLVSRIGIERKVDLLIGSDESLATKITPLLETKVACILVDEAQFLSASQVDDLFFISKTKDIPVICYGLRSDFQTKAFPGSMRLFELADELEELVTICRCGKRAQLNGRLVNGVFVSEGAQVAIDEKDDVTYESLCGKCYIEKVMHKTV